MDQALNLVTRVSDPSYASIASDASTDLDEMDAMDDLDVAADVATGELRAGEGTDASRAKRHSRAVRPRLSPADVSSSTACRRAVGREALAEQVVPPPVLRAQQEARVGGGGEVAQ